MASCGSEEEQSSCCPRGYIASGPSSLALRGYIHWRSQRPASTLNCGRHSKGQRCRRRASLAVPAPAPAPARPRRSPRCAGRAAAALPGPRRSLYSREAAPCAVSRRSGLLLCSCIYSEAGGDRFAGKPRGTRFSWGGRRALPTAAGVRETCVQVLPIASHPFFFTECNKSLHFLPLPSPASPFPAAGRRPRREQEG